MRYILVWKLVYFSNLVRLAFIYVVNRWGGSISAFLTLSEKCPNLELFLVLIFSMFGLNIGK